jgi:hypothetical protein
VRCSGDPDSLDGVIFPALRAAIVDGTPPHTLEPNYAVACERCVDLTRFYDVGRVKALRGEVIGRTDEYRDAYRDAYRALRAAGAVEDQRRATARAAMDGEKLKKRMDGIFLRELGRGCGPSGRVQRAFLGGMTFQGEICRFDTARVLCPRVYELDDSFGLGAAALEEAAAAAARAGCDVLACPDPYRPEELQHVLIPARELAFVTVPDRLPCDEKPLRRLRLDAMARERLSRTDRAQLRFAGRIVRSLRDEAQRALCRAKRVHDALEALCNPCVDFGGVYALAEREARGLLERRG